MKKLVILLSIMVSSYALAAKEIRVSTWLSPAHTMNNFVLKKWSKMVDKATNGEVKVKLVYHKGHPKDIFELVEDGVYDVGWSYHGYLPGRFKLTSIVELPGLEGGSEAASVMHWRVHQKYLAKANEHIGLVLLGLFTHGPGQIMLKKPIKSIKEMKGKKIRVGGGVQGFIAELMGVTPVPAPGSKVYELLATGVADGVFMPVGQQKGSRLSEVAPFIFQYPGSGMYLGSFSIFMNLDFFENLSKKNQEAIMSISGEALSRLAGKAWGDYDQEGIKAAKEANNTIHKATPNEVEEFKSLTKSIEPNWLKSVKNRNVNVKSALKELRRGVKNYK